MSLFLLAAVATGCGFGLRIGPIGAGAGIGAGPEAETSVDAGGLRVDRHEVVIDVAPDLTSSGTVATTRTIVSPAGVLAGQKTAMTYHPGFQSLELVEAWVERPDGRRIAVTEEEVFTRMSEAAQTAPGFVNSRTTTVVFPQLTVGSKTHTTWRFTDGSTGLGFNHVYQPDFSLPLEVAEITLNVPTAAAIEWRTRGPFDVKESRSGPTKTIRARLEGFDGMVREKGMVAPEEVLPAFVATSLKSWEEVGRRFRAVCGDAIETPPEIRAKAREIAGDSSGLEAARKLHRWVCKNISYVAVYLHDGDGWVPTRASKVLENGYGDCKDQAVLLASLLRAAHVKADPVLVDSRPCFAPLPLWTPLQFDHCMLWLPEHGVFANPANPYADLGVLEQPLADKFVVIATPDGAVGRTPAARAEENVYAVLNQATLDRDGTLRGHSTLAIRGRPAMRFRGVLARASRPEDVADNVLLQTPEGGFGDITSTDPTDLDVPLRCETDWQSDEALPMGEEVYFTVPVGVDFVNPQFLQTHVSQRARHFPAVAGAIHASWSHAIELPEEYEVARLPQDRSLQNDAGAYSATYQVDNDGRIRVERHLTIAKDRFAVSEYGPFRDLLLEVLLDMRGILVLRGEAPASTS